MNQEWQIEGFETEFERTGAVGALDRHTGGCLPESRPQDRIAFNDVPLPIPQDQESKAVDAALKANGFRPQQRLLSGNRQQAGQSIGLDRQMRSAIGNGKGECPGQDADDQQGNQQFEQREPALPGPSGGSLSG